MTAYCRSILWFSILFLSFAGSASSEDKLRVVLKTPADHFTGGNTTLLDHPVTIPYATIQSAINNKIKPLVNSYGDKTGHISLSSIDYDWSINSSASFSFPEQNQPTLTILSATQNKVRIELDAKARVKFSAVISAETDDHIPAPPLVEYPDIDGSIDLDIDFDLKAQADITLWPVLKVENASATIVNAEPKATVKDVAGDLTVFAGGVGVAIGFTPGGLLAGGPGAMSLAGILASNAAYDAAVDVLDDHLAAALEKGVNTANQEIEARLMNYIEPAVAGLNDLKTKALNTTVPGWGKSLQQLQSDAGLTLDVRSSPQSGLTVWVTARLDGASRNGNVSGTVQFPKAKCHKIDTSVAGTKSVQGILQAANQDLEEGMSCSALLAASDMKVRTFLGATPPGTSMGNWGGAPSGLKGIGSLKETTIRKDPGPFGTTGYFECRYEMTGLPISMLDFTSKGEFDSRLLDYGLEKDRKLVVAAVDWGLGGAGKCEGTFSSGGLTPNYAEEMKAKIDCPECPVVQPTLEHELIRPGVQSPQLKNPSLGTAGALKAKGGRAGQKVEAGKDALKAVPDAGYGGPNAKSPAMERKGGAAKAIKTPVAPGVDRTKLSPRIGTDQ